jgi:hypothetical protein
VPDEEFFSGIYLSCSVYVNFQEKIREEDVRKVRNLGREKSPS